MSTNSKIIIGLIVIVLIAIGFWYGLQGGAGPVVTENVTPVEPTHVKASPTPTTVDQDLTAIDAQVKAYDYNFANVSTAFTDKPIPQSQ